MPSFVCFEVGICLFDLMTFSLYIEGHGEPASFTHLFHPRYLPHPDYFPQKYRKCQLKNSSGIPKRKIARRCIIFALLRNIILLPLLLREDVERHTPPSRSMVKYVPLSSLGENARFCYIT